MKFPLLTRDMVNEFELRLSKVRMAMTEARLDAVLVGSTVNLFYLAGGVCRGYMYIPVDREPVFFVIPPAEPAGEFSARIRKPEQIPDLIAEKGYDIPARVGLEFDDLYYSEIERLRKVFASSEIADGSRVMRRARLVKTQ